MTPVTSGAAAAPQSADAADQWAQLASKLQSMWNDFQTAQQGSADPAAAMFDLTGWTDLSKSWLAQMPLVDPARQQQLMEDSVQLWQAVLGQYAPGPDGGKPESSVPELPRKDRRFADPRWQQQPLFALIHQTYLLMTERLLAMVDDVEGLDAAKREQLRFATKGMMEALSPANFPLTNPVVLERTLESGGENLVKGMEHLLSDLERGQLTHTDPAAFQLGRNIATTPGKVVHETPLYQLIQYSPTTEEVLAVPLVIFPPWINRFYILDLNPEKSFIRWAVEQGLTTFVVSWKSADASMADVVWDDYIRAQIDAVDHVRQRLDVPSTHVIGYCVAGTTLAATMAILARRGEADKIKSATFFTAQVDFERAGELLNFIDDTQIAAIENLARDGYLDGRVMAATFNLLRGTDLIWNYVVNNYLLGEEYPAFDLLHWNGDVTNLPAKWHKSYLIDLYRDNRLVKPDSLSADGTPIDLRLVETPSYIQAGKEDHIAPAESVWRITEHFSGPLRFVLAGSGHIAGVVNPPAAGKYQYWRNDDKAASLEEFIAGATEHKGSWWPDWIEWITGQDSNKVPAKGARKPGGKGDKIIEDAPGRYVLQR
ncbi:MAG: class I poly(R)-hydroxyalkanoic acid synthase [Allopontixanthobacter sp.]|nr:class I poly(R)-hydroxyalkanoic acid synthase [Allopontixanthobacter sp.]MDZ4307607.1 class I poly(R)-hydroxyalkanoic acid synthase [Allopontixanthobacter sp.]